jgi:dihydrofolate reductase
MMVSIIAAISDDGFIGQDGGIPWRLPRDVAHFRSYCAGKWLLLGRRTYGEMTGWFTNHHPLVLSRQANFVPTVGARVTSVAAAMALAQAQGAEEVVVLGGGEIFSLALPYVSRLILTRVHTRLSHGVRFPDWSGPDWRCLQQEEFPADPQHSFPHSITTYQRITFPRQP